jgi:glycosyltransferase involved in cell wall biosynthesis
MGSGSLEILYAAEHLLPAAGGAERFALEWMGALAGRHAIRALWLDGGAETNPAIDPDRLPTGVEAIPVSTPAPRGGYWRRKRERGQALGAASGAALDERGANVVVTALHAAPAVIAAAQARGHPCTLMLLSYESMCKYAFDAGTECRPKTGCRGCPHAASLDPSERRELLAAREAHEGALRRADALVAPSRAVADACAAWCGRRPEIVPGVTVAEPPFESPDGPLVMAAARWSPNKGLGLLEPIARALSPRPVTVTARGLPPDVRARLAQLENLELVDAPARRLLAGAGALLVPSQWPEPFGRLAFEGLAAGVPTLAAAVGGMTEYVPAPQLVDPPDSVAAWVRAVRTLDDPARRKAARRRGIEAARRIVAMPPAERLERVLLAVASR